MLTITDISPVPWTWIDPVIKNNLPFYVNRELYDNKMILDRGDTGTREKSCGMHTWLNNIYYILAKSLIPFKNKPPGRFGTSFLSNINLMLAFEKAAIILGAVYQDHDLLQSVQSLCVLTFIDGTQLYNLLEDKEALETFVHNFWLLVEEHNNAARI